MTILTKDDILSAQDLKTERVDVQEWGGTLIVSEMSGPAVVDFYAYMFPAAEEGLVDIDSTFRAALVAFSVVDEQGMPVFTKEDIPRLARKKASVLKRVFDVADRMNLVSVSARAEAEKNSSGGEDGGAASSSSPEN